MPNWVYNTIRIEGDADAIRSLVNNIALKTGVPSRESLSVEELVTCIAGNINSMESSRCPCLSSFEKEAYPETFLKWDTCNHPNGERLRVGDKDMFGNIITEEVLEEYRRVTAQQKELYGAVGWYDYNCLHFGVKWNRCINGISFSDGCLSVNVDTPWSTPDQWLARVSEEWGVTVTCEVEEEFRNFPPCILVFKDGALAEEQYKECYFVFGEQFSAEDREDAVASLLEAVGTDIEVPENPTDEFLLSKEFQDKLVAWCDALPEDDERKYYSPAFYLG